MSIRELAEIVAKEHMEALEFLNVVETAEEEEWELTEEELQEAHRLAVRAKVVVPDA